MSSTTTVLAQTPPAPVPRPRAIGWWGMAIFAATEATLVGFIVGSYYYLRVTTAVWPPAGTPKPALLAPLVLTAVLAAALLPLYAARQSARRGARVRAFWLTALATCIQAGYLAFQIHLFTDNLGQFGPGQSAYASIYYVLLGADHAHVAVGLLFDLWLLLRLAVRLTRYRLVALEAATLYWTVVVGITVVVTLTQLSPSL
jgi:heme/copper-type cytochrome/quinol oxidase subunit 3